MPINNPVSSFPSGITVGTTPNRLVIGADGNLRLYGTAIAYEDLRRDATSTRVGVVTPTDEVGFRGNNNYYKRSFVHNQADEVQFEIQFPHGWFEGSAFYPHIHFAPEIAGASNNAVQFIFEYYWANVNEQFSADVGVYTMTKTWTGNKQWYHLVALNAVGITLPASTISAIMKCRVYRDNTVTNNLAGKVTFLYIDPHVQIDGFGSNEEYEK